MSPKQFEIWLADLNPRLGTEAGKVRPVLIVQTDLLNRIHPSTLICPITTNVQRKSTLLRVHLASNLEKPSDIMIDQIRAIDNRRLVKKLGILSASQAGEVKQNIRIVMDLT